MGTAKATPIYPLQLNLNFKYNPLYFILDQIIRVILFVFFIKSHISTGAFVGLQFGLVILLFYLSDKRNERLLKKYRSFVNTRYSEKDIVVNFPDTTPDRLYIFQALLGFILSVWFFYHILEVDAWYMYIVVILFACLGTITFLFPLIFSFMINESNGLLSYQVFEKHIVAKDGKDVTTLVDVTKHYLDILQFEKLKYVKEEIVELDSIDYNDTQIAKLESELKSIVHRIDAWMLESVFLGGLAFSGFLTVASANFLGKETEVFREFITHSQKYLENCLTTGFFEWFRQIPKIFLRNDLYILIMLLCLMSSVFFLLALTLRLRLNSLTLTMDHLIRIMNVFNAKEEELFNLQSESSFSSFQKKRLEKVSRKVELAVNDANKLLKELKPVVTMMSIYRNIAVLLFYLVLIVSGFYFLPLISLIIFSLAIFTQAFRLLETYSKLEKLRNLVRKH